MIGLKLVPLLTVTGSPCPSDRAGDHKLIEFFEDGHLELYNLRDDAGEDNDLAEAEPEIAERLRTMLHDWLGQAGAKIPQPNPDYVPPPE